MRLAITIYPEDFAEADRIIHQLRGVRSLELDGYMGKAKYEKPFEKSGSETRTLADEQNEDNGTQAADMPKAPHPSTRPNINPGDPTITKIGQATTSIIMDELNKGRQPPSKYSEHMKLLWKRGEVMFDGDVYYL